MNGYEIVDSGHHSGGKEVVKTEWKTIRTTFNNFASLPTERDKFVCSPDLSCHGLKWKLTLYPGGSRNSNEAEKYVSIFLYCLSNGVKASFKIRVPSARRTLVATTEATPLNPGRGNDDCIKGADILNPSNCFLINGSLTIEVDIQVVLENVPWGTTKNNIGASAETAEAGWKQKHDALEEKFNNREKYIKSTLFKKAQEFKMDCLHRVTPFSLDMLKLLGSMGESTSDVTFEVSRGTGEEAKKTFHAHRLILSTRCPTLALLVEDYDNGAPIAISDIDPDMFHMLLRFIYGGVLPSKNNLKKEAREIIRAADRFGCTGLQHAAEAKLASFGIKTENTAELILFADATSCALLKEAALDYFVANSEAVMATEGYEQVTEAPAIMKEMMAALAAVASSKKRLSTPSGNGKDYKRMRVADLREKLETKGLDTDGSKETLADRLQTAETENEAAEALSQIHRSTVTP